MSSAGPQALARARSAFLGAEPFDPRAVREPILASWSRSRARAVPLVTGQVPYVEELDDDTPLTRAAVGVFRGLEDALGGEPVSLVLCDSAGTVLRRRTGDRRLERYLDRVFLARGFSYAERHVGTNGIGTSLESVSPTRVFGHEHFAENLEHLACAAAPVHHPVSGEVAGVVNLTCRERDAGVLLLTTATAIAAQVQEVLLGEAGRREQALHGQFRAACRRGPHAVVGLGADVVMLNRRARQALDAEQERVLLSQVRDALGNGRSELVVDLPDGRRAQVQCTLVSGDGRDADVVLQVRLPAPASAAVPGASLPSPRRPAVPQTPAMVAACLSVERHAASSTWLALHGEPGTGKTSLAASAARRARVLDAAGAGPCWLATVVDALAEPERAERALVLKHVDRLDPAVLRELAAQLRAATGQPAPWVVVTLAPLPAVRSPELAELLACFPYPVAVPALRHRAEELPRLAQAVLAASAPTRPRQCTPAALEVLARLPWAGNLVELRSVLERAASRHREGVLDTGDLPADLLAVARRRLTPLECLEREALLVALAQAHGSREQAARALGASRATVYRKVRRYGLAGEPT